MFIEYTTRVYIILLFVKAALKSSVTSIYLQFRFGKNGEDYWSFHVSHAHTYTHARRVGSSVLSRLRSLGERAWLLLGKVPLAMFEYFKYTAGVIDGDARITKIDALALSVLRGSFHIIQIIQFLRKSKARYWIFMNLNVSRRELLARESSLAEFESLNVRANLIGNPV